MGYGFLPSLPRSVDDIKKDPQILSGLTFKQGNLEGIHVENVHIKNMVFNDVQAENSRFVNVTFENCTFTKTNFRNSYFEDVAFKDCILQGEGNPEDVRNTTIFQYTVLKDILFENTKLYNTWIVDIDGGGGVIYFRRMHDVYPRGGRGPLITAGAINLRIVDSNLNNIKLLADDENYRTTFYAKNSTFTQFDFRSSALYFENCKFNTGNFFARDTIVVKNSSIARGDFGIMGKGFLMNNSYPNFDGSYDRREDGIESYYTTRIRGNNNGAVSIIGTASEPAFLSFHSGNITVRDAILKQPFFRLENLDYPISSFNLRDVRMLGGIWRKVRVEQGKWENVTIEPVVLLDKAEFSHIQAYNVEYPQGEPWRTERPSTVDISSQNVPFTWEDTRAPAPEELGMEWWPSEPGYHPKQ